MKKKIIKFLNYIRFYLSKLIKHTIPTKNDTKSSFDYYVVLPADDDYNVQNFPLIFKLLKLQKPDIICMSRFIKGGGMHNGPLIKTAIMRIVIYFL